MKPVKSMLEKLSGISTPFLGISRHPSSSKGLERKLTQLDKVIESYRSVESGIWMAKDHLRSHRLSKEDAVLYLRPITSKAGEVRDYIRAHQHEWGPLSEFINGMSARTLLCFAQLLALRPIILLSDESAAAVAPELEQIIHDIGRDLDALSYVVCLFHTVLKDGENSLEGDDREAFLWLNSTDAEP